LDQIKAIKFVKQHISAFGGDPDNISIYGESAGGQSVCTLVVSPLTKGLIKRAIVESGNCIGPWGPNGLKWGYDVSSYTMKQLGVTTLKELRSLPASQLQSWPNN